MYKKYLGVIVAVVALIFPTSAFAQTNNTFQPPQIAVGNIVLNESSVSQGDTVHGTFVMNNPGTTDATNIGYRISLVGNYQANTLAGTFYDTSALEGSVFVPAHGRVTVPFSYTLPIAVSGKGLGIEIQAYTSAGIPLSWSDYHLTVNAKQGVVVPPSLSVSNALLQLGTSTFPLQAGPVVHTGETPTLVISLSAAPKTTLPINAQVNLYNRVIAGTPLIATTSAHTLTPHTKTFSVALPLPTTAGVYDTQVVLETTNGTPIAPPFEIRYIVAGNIITIQTLTANQTSITAGNTVTLTMQYTGAPFDIRTGAVVNEPASTVHITLTNQSNNVIGTYQGILDPTKGTLIVPITLQGSGTSLSGAVTVIGPQDTVLAKYQTMLIEHASAVSHSFSLLWLWVIIGVLVVLSGFIVWLVVIKKKQATMVSLLMFVVAGALFFVGGQTAQAQITTQVQPTMSAGLYDTSGNSIQVMTEGQQFWVRGTVVDVSCVNAPQSASFTFDLSQSGGGSSTYGPYTQSQAAQDTSSHNTGNYYFDFAYGAGDAPAAWITNPGTQIPFTAPSVPGTYTVQITVNTISYYGIGNGYGSVSETLTYTVVPPSPTVNLFIVTPSGNVTSTTTTPGTPVNLEWNSTNASYCTNDFNTSNSLSGTAVVAPTVPNTYHYTEVCIGFGDISQTVNVTVIAPTPPTGTISASPQTCSISSGASTCSSSISWTTTNTPSASVVVQGPQWSTPQTFWSGSGNASQTASTISNGTDTFTLEDSSGTSLASVAVTGTCATGTSWNGTTCVTSSPPPAPTLSTTCTASGPQLDISWNSGQGGQASGGYVINISTDPSFTAFWNKQVSTGVTSVVVPTDTGFSPQGSASGPLVLQNGSTYYVYVYYIGSGQASPVANMLIDCSPPTIVSLTPTMVVSANSTCTYTLSWSVTNLNNGSCTLSNNINNSTETITTATGSGYTLSPAPSLGEQYTLSCTNAGGSASAQTTIPSTLPNTCSPANGSGTNNFFTY